ncbi:hypothetical protein RJT34_07146 [Clitoria ternatea]|uniref:Uncharacterized protein n=1 Tax=Clitoria ternatea TaxID=43366 RepID=A0AAN9PUP6_CLITE
MATNTFSDLKVLRNLTSSETTIQLLECYCTKLLPWILENGGSENFVSKAKQPSPSSPGLLVHVDRRYPRDFLYGLLLVLSGILTEKNGYYDAYSFQCCLF